MEILGRPFPPGALLESLAVEFEPDEALANWIVATFIDAGSPLYNPEHDHLAGARIGALWTNVENVRGQRRIAAMAEKPMPPATGGKWARARWEHQVVGWFGEIPDFILTFDAMLAVEAPDLSWCCLCEHELHHCGQACDEYGAPKFHSAKAGGGPIFAIVGHDVEVHIADVRRYGIAGAPGRVADLIAAASLPPEIGAADCAMVCGTCARMTA